MSIHLLKKRAAFSMLELVFVIAILGIVSSLGAEIIAQVYESYLTERASYRSSIKTQLAVNQLANRLAYAIPNTVIARGSQTNTNFVTASYIDNSNYQVIQWLGYDSDSFGAITTGNRRSGWSGFIDLANSSATSLSTPGSRLQTTDDIIGNLSSDTGSKDIGDAIILFPEEYTVNSLGYGSDNSDAHPIVGGTGSTLTINDMTGRSIREQYKLAWTSYAIVPMPSATGRAGLVDLYLRYNFQPWIVGSTYANAPSQLLLRDVSVFQFTASVNTIRFKICQREYLSETFSINTCKEKAVIR